MDGHEYDLLPEHLKFAVFSDDEIKELSVLKILTSLTFNVLGRPLAGGLYDIVLGDSGNKSDICGTCFGRVNCPGHFGHIELNAPVYNPFFIKVVFQILRMTCLKCFTLQIKNNIQEILTVQLDLIDSGYIIEAQQLELLKSVYSTHFDASVKDETGCKYETTGSVLDHPKIIEMYKLLESGENKIDSTKTICALRTQLTRSLQIRSGKMFCYGCSAAIPNFRYSYKKLVYTLPQSERNGINCETSVNRCLLADECAEYFRQIYKKNSKFLSILYPILNTNRDERMKCPTDMFFMSSILVTPPKARPCNYLLNQIVEHQQTINYRNIIDANSVLKVILLNLKNSEELNDEAKALFAAAKGESSHEKFYQAWQDLQTAVDQLLDTDMGKDKLGEGLKQVIEKKDGLLRKHMMGKRVNYAARTVITPDPNVNVDEIGIPDIFARKLSYPVPVTNWNVTDLRKMVRNGPDIHPGANYIEDEKGFKILIPADDPAKRESISKLLLTYPENGVKVVHRHLLNGDMLLLNRQPTLHKPSIMAHKVRILKGEKAFRLHYSNCKAYNADFDGDEMNAHFPQNELARSEAYNIVNVANQYLVPKDGTPLGGLIQDHVISGVKMSIRGRFFNREDYHQLVFQGLSNFEGNIKTLPPTILKPRVLWSGKQILSTIIMNLIPEDLAAINLTSTAKITSKCWNVAGKRKWKSGGTQLRENEMTESEIIIRQGELLAGVLDKQQYGATQYGLVHCMYELYGGNCSTRLLTSFTKVFTSFLQSEGFTLGVQDILVTKDADVKRSKIIQESRQIGPSIVSNALELDHVPEMNILAEEMSEAYIKDDKFRIILDRKYKSSLDDYTNSINKICLPDGLISKFPNNNLQLMVLSGAKGSLVNTMQISSLLGQIELEGKRPPLMISGKTLPSFATFETSPKSGGFIDGRFMTGIQPQEFFFHCMAGREGLIDTAVKTSRSGYLQRCLIKHLEGLNVAYDLTVRDSDNSVVQFLYGEDGFDVLKARFYNPKCMKFLDENADVLLHQAQIDKIKDEESMENIKKHLKKIKRWRTKHKKKTRFSAFQKFTSELRDEIEIENGNELDTDTGHLIRDKKMIKLWNLADNDKKEKYRKKYTKCPDPIISKFKPDNFYSSISEYLDSLINKYCEENPHRKSEISDILYLKSMKSFAEPGEPVGLLAAQSIGEPSTQMTLNTFHFAGRGEMNVTLGIPRLREILMMASIHIKTPSMDIPILPNQLPAAEKLRKKLNLVVLEDVLEYVTVKNYLVTNPDIANGYELYFKFLPRQAYEENFCIKPKTIIKYMNKKFFIKFYKEIRRASKEKTKEIDLAYVDDEEVTKMKNGGDNDEDLERDQSQNAKKKKVINVNDSTDDDDDDDVAVDDDDATGIKLKNRKQDENDYDEPEDAEEIDDASDKEDLESVHENLENTINVGEKDEENLNESVTSLSFVKDFKYDEEEYLWCKIKIHMPINNRSLDASILKSIVKKTIIHEVNKIKRAIIYKNNDDVILKTDGINIVEMFKYNKILDLNRLYTNDIHEVVRKYGIEAATRVIVKEVKNVFNVYGIQVDPRHLLLIADYMTFDGTFQPLSRKGIESSSSPFQQMTFESSLQFLKSATINGRQDDLSSPSSRLLIGLPIKSGTGSFEVFNTLTL